MAVVGHLLVPPARVIVPSCDAVTPPAATGADVVVSGGQNLAQAPAHTDLS